MSDVTPDTDDVVQNDPAGMRKVLEKQGKELAEKVERIAQLERAEAFRGAGIPDVKDGEEGTVQALFRDSFKGELNPESIKEAWDKLGIPEPPEPHAQPAQQQAEPQAQQQPTVDPTEAAAIVDAQQVRTEFSPGLSDDTTEAMKALHAATSLEDIAAAAEQAGVKVV